MTLEEAMDLARRIHDGGHITLIAIGRFVPPDQITAESPWGCSVTRPDGRQQTVWSPAQLWELLPQQPRGRRAESPRHQPTLF